MKNDISILIKLLLREVGKAVVPGLGTFERKTDSAEITPDRFKIHPPLDTISFSENQVGSFVFVNYVAENLGISIPSAESEIAAFVERQTTALLNTGEAKIEGVGILSRDGNEVTFTDTYSDGNKLPTLAIAPVKKFTEALKPAYTPKPSKGFSSWKGWFNLIMFLLAFMFILWKGCSLFDNDTTSSTPPETNSEVLIEGSTVSYEDTITSRVDDSTIGTPVVNTFGQAIPDNKRCIIVTGSFRKARNVVQMEAKLMSHGHTVYKSEYDGLTRVGIEFDCEEVDLVSYVQEIRKSIVSTAWYLDPELEVAYAD